MEDSTSILAPIVVTLVILFTALLLYYVREKTQGTGGLINQFPLLKTMISRFGFETTETKQGTNPDQNIKNSSPLPQYEFGIKVVNDLPQKEIKKIQKDNEEKIKKERPPEFSSELDSISRKTKPKVEKKNEIVSNNGSQDFDVHESPPFKKREDPAKSIESVSHKNTSPPRVNEQVQNKSSELESRSEQLKNNDPHAIGHRNIPIQKSIELDRHRVNEDRARDQKSGLSDNFQGASYNGRQKMDRKDVPASFDFDIRRSEQVVRNAPKGSSFEFDNRPQKEARSYEIRPRNEPMPPSDIHGRDRARLELQRHGDKDIRNHEAHEPEVDRFRNENLKTAGLQNNNEGRRNIPQKPFDNDLRPRNEPPKKSNKSFEFDRGNEEHVIRKSEADRPQFAPASQGPEQALQQRSFEYRNPDSPSNIRNEIISRASSRSPKYHEPENERDINRNNAVPRNRGADPNAYLQNNEILNNTPNSKFYAGSPENRKSDDNRVEKNMNKKIMEVPLRLAPEPYQPRLGIPKKNNVSTSSTITTMGSAEIRTAKTSEEPTIVSEAELRNGKFGANLFNQQNDSYKSLTAASLPKSNVWREEPTIFDEAESRGNNFDIARSGNTNRKSFPSYNFGALKSPDTSHSEEQTVQVGEFHDGLTIQNPRINFGSPDSTTSIQQGELKYRPPPPNLSDNYNDTTVNSGLSTSSYDTSVINNNKISQDSSSNNNTTTQWSGENTVTQPQKNVISLPAFLLVELDGWMIRKQLGSGGAADVFEYEVPSNLSESVLARLNGSKRVAVKIMKPPPGLSYEEFRASFFQEVSIMYGAADCKNVIQLVGYSEVPVIAIVTKVYPSNLSDELANRSDIKWDTYVMKSKCASELASGMAHLHKYGILHNDLKTPNILLSYPDNRLSQKSSEVGSARSDFSVDSFPSPVITDFGIACIIESFEKVQGRRRAYNVGVSVSYAAPEILRFYLQRKLSLEQFDISSDIYSYAIVLYEIITRTIPFTELIYTLTKMPSLDSSGKPIELWTDIGERIINGYRPTIDPVMLRNFEQLFKIVQKNWSGKPSERQSSFEEIKNDISIYPTAYKINK